jgi:ABC-type Fe3+-citrate transport system substrate-binding protein
MIPMVLSQTFNGRRLLSKMGVKTNLSITDRWYKHPNKVINLEKKAQFNPFINMLIKQHSKEITN